MNNQKPVLASIPVRRPVKIKLLKLGVHPQNITVSPLAHPEMSPEALLAPPPPCLSYQALLPLAILHKL